MTHVVEMVNITKNYGDYRALTGVELRLEQGSYTCIRGASGSGKSTLLNIVGLLDAPSSGWYSLNGVDVAGLSERQHAELRARHIGFVFQSFHLIPYRSVIENVTLALMYAGLPASQWRGLAEEALVRVGLSHRMAHMPTQLSGGEAQRVAIARAVAPKPTLLLCDEPTGNLDSVNSAAVMDLLDELNADGATILLITHDATIAGRAQEVLTMSDGAFILTSIAAL